MNINKVTEIINQKGYVAEIKELSKGSTTKTGIVIGTDKVRPTFYPDSFNLDDLTDEEIADQIIGIFEKNKTPNFNISDFTDINYIKKNMFVSVRRPMEDEFFTKSFLDIQLVLNVKVDDSINGFASFKVTKEMANQFKFDESIFDEAIQNMEFNLKPLGAVIGHMIDEEIPDVGMYVVTTDIKMFGGSAIFDRKYLKSIADMLNSDIVIIPSSINEILIVKKNENIKDIDDLNAMVTEVNATQVEPAEQLADHVYIFYKESSIIATC